MNGEELQRQMLHPFATNNNTIRKSANGKKHLVIAEKFCTFMHNDINY